MLVEVWQARSKPMVESMGLSWQQGPLSTGAIGRFLVPEPPPKRLLYVERLRRRMRVRFGGIWIADSENVLLFFEPGLYPVAYFPQTLRRLRAARKHFRSPSKWSGTWRDFCR